MRRASPGPTPAERRALVAYLLTGSRKQAAYRLGVTDRGAEAALDRLYQRLGTWGALQTAQTLAPAAYRDLVRAIEET